MRNIILLMVLILAVIVNAESNKPNVIDNGGGKAYAPDSKNYASIGQSVINVSGISNVKNQAGFITTTQISYTYVEEPNPNGNLPVLISIGNPYPNPFNASTKIDLNLPEPSDVRFEVFDVLGYRVSENLQKYLKPGKYTLTFYSGNLPSGIYLYRISSETTLKSGKFILVR